MMPQDDGLTQEPYESERHQGRALQLNHIRSPNLADPLTYARPANHSVWKKGVVGMFTQRLSHESDFNRASGMIRSKTIGKNFGDDLNSSDRGCPGTCVN